MFKLNLIKTMIYAFIVLYMFTGSFLVMSNIEVIEEDFSDSLPEYLVSFFFAILMSPLIYLLAVLGIIIIDGGRNDEQ